MRHYSCLVALAVAMLVPRAASAHFLWLVSEPEERPAKIQVFFAETAAPDDPGLLEQVQAAKVWAVSAERDEPQSLTLAKANGALEAELPARSRQATIILSHTYGVVSRGGEPFLLKYYSKAYPSVLPGTWRAVKDKERLPLEITPSASGAEMVLQVTFQGSDGP